MSDTLPRGDEPPDWRGLWQKARATAGRQKEVIEAVSARRSELPRDALRSLFEREMKRTAMAPDPIWVERKLDELEWSASERMRQRAHSVNVLAGIASGFARSLRGKGVGGTLGRISEYGSSEHDPKWMQPPAGATYRASAMPSENAAIALDPAAQPVLERVSRESPRRLVGEQVVLVDVWLDDEPNGELVVVRLGQHRIGTFSREISQRLRSLMDAAAQQRMKPRMAAQLAKASYLRPPYLLVAKVPSSDVPGT